MKKLGSILFTATLATALVGQANAQTNDEETAVRACLLLYLSFDAAQMEKAFHQSGTVKHIDNKTGEYKDETVAAFLTRVRAITTKPERKSEIVSLNIEGTAAQAKIRIEQKDLTFTDYMNLLKIDGTWRIVSKIFQRTDK
ncbi:nuclear transport factor 2 family protein [Pseudobacter ginsenosidimutans]|uniref:Putative lumazine-binding protein n=1 Tax=Pseudobacter ginsenosidimutans TaxID=661488 RepID=A0A4V2EZM5_9BACT|nr:nuclear transport factor 2 family protein [Pseudobacter ginsenosidimutans]QEC45479.1 nuclear transport factor 2 family protein [Pseudobacter ginsenosidimutans]RZS67010.1 putative lumazine-binding protein [Pseudobacter ginsenosidimutans]